MKLGSISPKFKSSFHTLDYCSHLQDSLDYGYRVSPSHSPILSPQCLERPFDERSHNRRPSDEASLILRKISTGGNSGASPYTTFGPSLAVNMPENKTHSLPPGFMRTAGGFQSVGAMGMDTSAFHDFIDIARMNQQQHTLGIQVLSLTCCSFSWSPVHLVIVHFLHVVEFGILVLLQV